MYIENKLLFVMQESFKRSALGTGCLHTVSFHFNLHLSIFGKILPKNSTLSCYNNVHLLLVREQTADMFTINTAISNWNLSKMHFFGNWKIRNVYIFYIFKLSTGWTYYNCPSLCVSMCVYVSVYVSISRWFVDSYVTQLLVFHVKDLCDALCKTQC